MVERKLFKTKLCVLYQKGRCSRQTCSFAHGDSELRRSFGSYNGGRDYRDGDLRVKLERRLSLQRRFSPGRDARGRDRFRAHSPSRSPEKSDRKRRKKQHDGQSDFSGSLKISDGIEDQVKEGQFASSDSKIALREKLKELLSDIKALDHRRLQLEICVEEKVQEADILTSRIEELETQLHKEKEDGKRIASKIKKCVKEHNRYLRIQDDLKRSQARFQKLVYQLGSDASGAAGNEENSSVNIVSDEETTNCHVLGPQTEMQTISSPNKKKLHADRNSADVTVPEVNLARGGGHQAESRQFEKPSRWSVQPARSNVDTEVEAANNGDKVNVSAGFSSADKSKVLGSGLLLPSTGIAAHATIDQDVEIEVEKFEEVEMVSSGVEKRAIYAAVRMLPFRLPPPVPRNAYLQYEGDDENVDVDGL
ncbi:hypothetical protein Ddye_017685 [Dipteronia dyeriana]|uniref:C3H1-type domain-containing protein n=1 Tax=Dipteronia dyeriana TaxID=168575 RepID=A0AAD9U9M6_9ROSI|nr:hypothetical protein Ddye_017685 [Dipteronia dyeriana]